MSHFLKKFVIMCLFALSSFAPIAQAAEVFNRNFDEEIKDVVISDNGEYMLIQQEGRVTLSTIYGKMIKTVSESIGSFQEGFFSKDDKSLILMFTKKVISIDLDGNIKYEIDVPGNLDDYEVFAISEDRQLLAKYSDRKVDNHYSIFVFNLTTGKKINEIALSKKIAHLFRPALLINNDGILIVMPHGRLDHKSNKIIYNGITGKKILQKLNNTGFVIGFSPENSFFLSDGTDGRIDFYDYNGQFVKSHVEVNRKIFDDIGLLYDSDSFYVKTFSSYDDENKYYSLKKYNKTDSKLLGEIRTDLLKNDINRWWVVSSVENDIIARPLNVYLEPSEMRIQLSDDYLLANDVLVTYNKELSQLEFYDNEANLFYTKKASEAALSNLSFFQGRESKFFFYTNRLRDNDDKKIYNLIIDKIESVKK